jgi:DNA-binding transcriptional LysR family regulator
MPPPRVLRLPCIDGVRAFEATARLGSFERAALTLHVTASAVSKRVATLEALLGAGLCSRAAPTRSS